MSTGARATDIVFTRHGARRGLAWLAEAYAMFRRSPLRWVLLVLLYYVMMLAIHEVPLVGPLVMALLKPVFTVGLLAAAWTQERGGAPAPAHLFKGFRTNLAALVPLGVVFVVGIAGAIAATALVDGGLLVEVVFRSRVPTDEEMRSGGLQASILAGLLFALPTILALWFAPALVAFQDAGAATALGASIRAAAANWKPLAVYALGVFAFGLLLPFMLAQLMVLVFPPESLLDAVRVMYLVYGTMFAATLHISDYVSYRDVFHAGETLAPLAPAEPDGRR